MPTTPAKSTTATPAKSAASDVVSEVGKVVESYVLDPKSGLKTSELWLSVLTLVDEFALTKWHANLHLSNNATIIIGIANGAVTAVYTAARTWLKAKHVAALPPAPKLS